MTYYNFIEKTKKYLKSVRMIKNYISFDMSFPTHWSILKNQIKDVEVIKNNSDNDILVISFVTPFDEEKINSIEETIEKIIKYNIEKEEKERLFKYKVQELKNIFENKKLDSLKNLKFDLDELTILNDDEKQKDRLDEDREGDSEDEPRNKERQTESESV
jgi:hypothetical protein